VGDINNLGLDLPSGRIAYVILGSGGVLGVGDNLYVMPPNAFTLASDNKSLVTSIDKEKLEGAPTLNNQKWSQLSDARFGARVYQHYGKQPYWTAQLTPTGREDAVTPNSQGRISGDRNERISRERNRDRDRDDDGLRARRGNAAATQAAAGAFANVEDARQLIGMNIENARGANLGKLSDIVVDLESGRALYGVVDLKGQGAMKAVAPANLVLRANDKAIRFNGDQQKLENAPAFNRNSDLTSSEYAARVYNHFGQQHSWFSANDKFGHVHRASDVLTMKVQNVQDQNIGQVQNLIVDLQKGRVLYVILNAAQAVGRSDNLFALPPNIFTMAKGQNTLVASVDKAKLEGAPRFNRGEWTNPNRADEVYRYYGKQGYWTGTDLSPTGRD
jgi:sporulation protein YlmC with PRC-barrel domain